MRFPGRAWLLVFPSLAFACQLVDPASDLGDHDEASDGGAPDGSLDASVRADAGDATGSLDSSSDAQGDAASDATLDAPGLCDGVGTMLCEDFNNHTGLVYDGGPWALLVRYGPDNARPEYGGHFFEALFPNASRAPDGCYLQSYPQPVGDYWVLDFDLDGSPYQFGTGATSYMNIAALDFLYDASVDGSLVEQNFQLQVGTDNSAQIVLLQSKLGSAPQTLGIAITDPNQPFLSDQTAPEPCHITFSVYTRGAQTSTAVSTCVGRAGMESTKVDASNGLVSSDGGSPLLLLGFSTDGGSFPSVGGLDYDNVTLRLLPK